MEVDKIDTFKKSGSFRLGSIDILSEERAWSVLLRVGLGRMKKSG
jgi:hypothetical protein